MDTTLKALLFDLLSEPAPTGAEQGLQRMVRERMKGVAESIDTDLHGNLICGINTHAKRRVMLAGHCDQIGYMVKSIDKSGYLRLASLGGSDYGVLLGEHVLVKGTSGWHEGIVGRKPVHEQANNEVNQVPPLDQMWVDIGVTSDDEARKHVNVGDYVVLKPRAMEMGKDLVVGSALDDRAGLAVCLEVLRRLSQEKGALKVALYAVSTVQEEIGSRGAATAAFAVAPEVAIAVDVVNATDDPSNQKSSFVPKTVGGGPCLSHGPNSNPRVNRLLMDAARKLKIPYQLDVEPSTASNDAKPMQVSRAGTAAGTVGIAQRNMHTQVEICSLTDIENAARMLVEFVKSIDNETDFRPLYFND